MMASMSASMEKSAIAEKPRERAFWIFVGGIR
jgi:hypothetical protein